MNSINPMAQYTVGAIKKFRGHDGYGYSCNLLRLGKKVAEILEDGWGGGLQFSWLDNKSTATVTNRTYDDKEFTFEGTVEEALFYAQVMQMPKMEAHGELPEMNTSPDIIIDDMVNDSLAMKKINSDLKKNLTVQCKDCKLLTWKVTATHTASFLKEHALKKYPDGKIINDLPVDEIFKIYKEAHIIA